MSHKSLVVWQNTEKFKVEKVVADHIFSASSVGIFLLARTVTVLHCTSSVVNTYGDVAMLT